MNNVFPATRDIIKITKVLTNDVYVFNLFYYEPEILGGIIFEIRSTIKLLNYKKNYDIIIFHKKISLLCLFLSKLLKKKTLVYIGGSLSDNFIKADNFVERIQAWNAWTFKRIILKQCDMTIMPCLLLAERKEFDIIRDKIRLAPSRLIDLDFNRKFRITKRICDRLNLVGYIGRLSNEKGVINFIKSIPRILAVRKDVRFLIVGDGPLKDEVEKIINKLDITRYVKLVGWVTNPEMYYNEMKLLILPSISEGLPSVILEAMACGTPVLASRICNLSGLIIENETGFFLKSIHPHHIAEATIKLINHPNLLENSSEKAYNWLKENFDEGKVIETWRKILVEVASN